jgi:hypothetical protein
LKLIKKIPTDAIVPVPNTRYYYRLTQKSRRYRVNLEEKEWCDMSHQHFDWYGLGNSSWLHSRRHLTALLVALVQATKELANSNQPYQLFVIVNLEDRGGDAVFVHTKNPNGTDFPVTFPGKRIDVLPSLLAGRLDLCKYNLYVYGEAEDRSYTIELKPTAIIQESSELLEEKISYSLVWPEFANSEDASLQW